LLVEVVAEIVVQQLDHLVAVVLVDIIIQLLAYLGLLVIR
jgi:hypothetical protein